MKTQHASTAPKPSPDAKAGAGCVERLVRELRFEAGINSLCGSEEWTVLLTEVADRLEHMDKMLRSVHAATDLTAARRRALKGLTFPNTQAHARREPERT
jgi:hypothetical protein